MSAVRRHAGFGLDRRAIERQLALLPTFLIGDALREGSLVPLLEGWDFGRLGIHVLYPQRRFRPLRVRVFVDALLAHFGSDPDGDPFWPGADIASG